MGATPEEDGPSVVIPNHLQLHTPDCLHLSFGSFGSGTNAAISGSGSFASRPLNSNLEEASTAVDVSAIGHSETRYVMMIFPVLYFIGFLVLFFKVYLSCRNPEYYDDEHLRSTSDENLIHRTGHSAGDYDSTSVSQAEALKQETPEAGSGNQYSFPSAAPGFAYESSQQLNVAFTHPQTSSQMQNLAPFSSVMVSLVFSL